MNKSNARVDIMVDIETLGNKPNSTIAQIAAASFDIKTGKIIDTFNECCDISKEDVKVSGSTLKWWLETDSALLKDLLEKGTMSHSELLKEFKFWLLSGSICSYDDVYLWGNGILFDNNMLKTQLEEIGLSYPIFYRNDRDVRTLVELAAFKEGVDSAEFIKWHSLNNRKHDAMNDVLTQINIVHKGYEVLMSTD